MPDLARLYQRTIDILYQPRCALCQVELESDQQNGLCRDCWRTLPFMPDSHCRICCQPFGDTTIAKGADDICMPCQYRPLAIDKVLAPFVYREPIVSLILRLKYADDLALSHFFADAMQKVIMESWREAILVPVPIHHRRLWRRRYNQAEVLARIISKLTTIPLETKLLDRTQATTQKNIGADARFRQLRHAFAINKKYWQPHRPVILVDDVVTTGATMHAIAKLLKQQGGQKIYAVTIARTPLMNI